MLYKLLIRMHWSSESNSMCIMYVLISIFLYNFLLGLGPIDVNYFNTSHEWVSRIAQLLVTTVHLWGLHISIIKYIYLMHGKHNVYASMPSLLTWLWNLSYLTKPTYTVMHDCWKILLKCWLALSFYVVPHFRILSYRDNSK